MSYWFGDFNSISLEPSQKPYELCLKNACLKDKKGNYIFISFYHLDSSMALTTLLLLGCNVLVPNSFP